MALDKLEPASVKVFTCDAEYECEASDLVSACANLLIVSGYAGESGHYLIESGHYLILKAYANVEGRIDEICRMVWDSYHVIQVYTCILQGVNTEEVYLICTQRGTEEPTDDAVKSVNVLVDQILTAVESHKHAARKGKSLKESADHA